MIPDVGQRIVQIQFGNMVGSTFHITISGSVVAAYAAVMSTITGAVQLFNFLRDRARVKISVSHKMRMFGDPLYEGKTLTIVRVVNAGRRPVTITTVGARRLHPHDAFVFRTTNPNLPHELTEGKSLIAIMPEPDVDNPTIDWWEASDAVGRTYKLQVASRYDHIRSKVRLRREWRRNRREKAKALKAVKP